MAALPTHAYVPGVTARHPENAFEEIKKSVTAGQTINEIEQSAAFRAGLQFLDAGFYWETHEVLEPVWMVLPEGSIEKTFVQGLIQLANGRLKLQMKKPKAAQRLVVMARELMPDQFMPDGAPSRVMTLETETVHGWIDDLEKAVNLSL